MSGFEVAGVVLGGFPLLVSVADQYEKGFEPLKKWWRFREVFVDFIDAIDIQKQAFDLLLERFLTTAEIPYEEIRSLMTDPRYEGWQDQDMAQAMLARLGPSYDVFMSTIRKMNILMTELQKSLCLKDGKINWAKDGASRWDYQLKRVRFSFDKKGPKLISDLEKYNGDLQRLLDSIEKLDTPRQARHNSMWASIFQAIRQHACSLYSAIRYGMTCQCQAIHKANLRLENRNTENWTSTFKIVFELQPADKHKIRREIIASLGELTASETHSIASTQSQTSPTNDNALSELRRDFESMSISQTDLSLQPYQSYKMDTEKHVEKPILSNLIALVAYGSHGIRPSALKDQGGMPGKDFYSKKKKSARFPTSEILCRSEPTTKTLDINAQALNMPENMKVNNLCSAIKDCPADTSNIGYLANDGKRHNLRVLNIETLNPLSQLVTLDSLLTGEAGIRLSRKERYTIALILASSLLQLQATPWSPSSLSKKNIYLYHQGSHVLVNETYVTQQFVSMSTDSLVEGPLNETLTPETRLAIQDSISALGILLLELCFNSPIEAQPLRNAHLDGDGKASKYTDFMTARDWTQYVVEEDPKMYRVIRACFDTWEERADWGNKAFVNAVYGCIVGPLERLVAGWDK